MFSMLMFIEVVKECGNSRLMFVKFSNINLMSYLFNVYEKKSNNLKEKLNNNNHLTFYKMHHY